MMPGPEMLDCYKNGTDLIDSESSGGKCCKQGESCQNSVWADLWDGKKIVSGKEAEVQLFSDKLVNLRKALGSVYLWTARSCGNSSENSCGVYAIYVATGQVSHHPRPGDYAAICQ